MIGVGPGRGIGLMFITTELLTVVTAVSGLLYPRLRRIEIELPDAIHQERN
ncbi:hypothetical protein KFU94_56400 [Chloroflexi bacterium TSY]|nr:hypothetical protein [Chloroflexi bacterium TSY]